MSATPRRQLGPYELIERIGEGGMGEVWKARDTRLNRIVAIKQLKGEHSRRFEKEARAILQGALGEPIRSSVHWPKLAAMTNLP